MERKKEEKIIQTRAYRIRYSHSPVAMVRISSIVDVSGEGENYEILVSAS